jgi:hypothetical protein
LLLRQLAERALARDAHPQLIERQGRNSVNPDAVDLHRSLLEHVARQPHPKAGGASAPSISKKS